MGKNYLSHGEKLSISTVQSLVDKVHEEILTSNDIVSRLDYPYFYNSSSVPKSLQNFKKKIEEYRIKISEHLMKVKSVKPLPEIPTSGDLSRGSFTHQFVLDLTVASFGIGECGECSSALVKKLLKSGCEDFAFVGFALKNAKTGMEQFHSVIIANLHNVPKALQKDRQLCAEKLFSLLPQDVVIADTFLGIAFSPRNIPALFQQYIQAYGGETELMTFMHLFNCGPHFLRHYTVLTKRFHEELKPVLSGEQVYDMHGKITIQETALLGWLREDTGLDFIGVRDEEYYLDAILKIPTKDEHRVAFRLQNLARGFGQFYRSQEGQLYFVLAKINDLELTPNVGRYLYQFFKPQRGLPSERGTARRRWIADEMERLTPENTAGNFLMTPVTRL